MAICRKSSQLNSCNNMVNKDIHDKKMPDDYPTGGRGSGRTTWMIRQVIDDIEKGQSLCLVYGHSFNFVHTYLMDKAEQELARCRIPFKRVTKNEIECCVQGKDTLVNYWYTQQEHPVK